MTWNGVADMVPFGFTASSNNYNFYISSATCAGVSVSLGSPGDVYGITNTVAFNQKWAFVTLELYNGPYTANTLIFINGQNQKLSQCLGSAWPTSTISTQFTISGWSVNNLHRFNRSIANVQIYNTSLSSYQVFQLYEEGISGVPLNTNSLVAWYPLRNNANDLSGNGFNGVASNVVYTEINNYSMDSFLTRNVPTNTSDIPGLLSSCRLTSQCLNYNSPGVSIGYNPLEVQSQLGQVANLNGYSSNIPTGVVYLPGNTVPRTISFWAYPANGNVPAYQYLVAETGTASSLACSGYCLSYGRSSSGVPNTISVSACGVTFSSASPAQMGQWSHFILELGPNSATGTNTINLTINGVTGISVLDRCSSNSNSLVIGSANGNGDFFNGSITNVQIYGGTLTSAQRLQLFNEGVFGLPITNNANLMGWYPLQGNANDYSGNNNKNVFANNVTYPYFSGLYAFNGLSTVSSSTNEWGTIGITR